MTAHTHQNPSCPLRSVIWLILFAAACVAGLFWLKSQNSAAAALIGPLVALVVMGSALLVARRQERTLDEVQLAGQRFAIHQAFHYGAMATIMLLTLPPVTNWLIDLVSTQVGVSLEASSRRAARLSFIYGACLVVLIQSLTMVIANAFWYRRMGDTAERAP